MADVDTTLEQPVLDMFYRVSKEWQILGACTSGLGAAGIWLDWRAGGGVLMACSVLCQVVSWRAMRGAQRLENKRLARIDAEGGMNG
jgi:hypothetical protein